MKSLLRLARASILLLLLLLLTLPALAQGSLAIRDDIDRLTDSQVERAAQPLVDKGATVAIYAAQTGGDAEFDRRLQRDQLLRNGQIPNNLIAIYVSLEDRYSAIRYGNTWRSALSTRTSNIRNDNLNANLSASDFTAGVVSALGAINTAVGTGSGNNGGTSGGVTSGGVQQNQSDDGSGLLGFGLCVGVLGALGLGGWYWQRTSKTRAAAALVNNARQAAEEARKRAGAAVADLAQEIRDASEKAQFDKVSYSAEDTAQLAAGQQEANERFVKAQERFSTTEEALRDPKSATEEGYQKIAASYDTVVEQVGAVRELLAQAQARRSELDRIGAAAPGEVDRAKKALADVADRLGALSDDFPNAQQILSDPAAQVAQAESLLQEHRAAQASKVAAAASAQIATLAQAVTRYADLREGISVGRAAAQKVVDDGYRIEPGLRAFDASEAALRHAAEALARGGPPAAEKPLAEAEQLRTEGVERGGGMPTLRQANSERLPKIQQAGEQLAAYLEEGRRTFDHVDEFAESTWSDIRGNGGEAQAAATRAHLLWEEAQRLNSMETQDFLGARQRLDSAAEQIAFARQLIDSIIQRLKDLEAARDAAKQEIADAKADIAKGWEYVRSNDADVGKQPEKLLGQAAELLERASSEVGKERPDWLALVRDAQEANRLADQAMADARSEVETMAALRKQVERAQMIAAAEVQKTAQFATLHRDTLAGALNGQIDQLQAQVQEAYRAFQAIEGTAEKARADALRGVLKRYTDLRDHADQVYKNLQAAFERVDKLRQSVSEEIQRAQRSVADAERMLRNYAGFIPASSDGVRSLEAARANLTQISSMRITTQDEADRARALAQQARASADHAEQVLRSEGQARQHRPHHGRGGGTDMGDVIGGVVIGSVLSDLARGNTSGGGWGGGSSGSWGGGGSSGGWGGGDSGGWGSGGGDSGGWGGGDSGGGGGDSGGW
ncbi:MAG TPA: chromosome partitioning protein ParA [Roseiflexaceae bacterium]|nr:chromosome partitioning protein ParA [Roseiflexaceae bacterium]